MTTDEMAHAETLPQLDASSLVDGERLTAEVKDMYRHVARDETAALHFEVGRAVAERLGYTPALLDAIPAEALASFAGVGFHLDLAALRPGERVLDLGSGSGTDAFCAACLVGSSGRVVGVDMTDAQLEKSTALRDRHGYQQVEFVEARIEELPFEDASFDAALNLFTSLGYLARDEDVGVLRELYRVLRPGCSLVVETMHRDRLARIHTARSWDPLPGGALLVEERDVNWVTGELSALHLVVEPGGERVERRFVHRVYTATEWVAMLDEAGFSEIECFADWQGESRPSPDARLIVRGRRALD